MIKLISDKIQFRCKLYELKDKQQTCKTLFSLGTAALALTLVVILMYVLNLTEF